jgi:hypothetical protein
MIRLIKRLLLPQRNFSLYKNHEKLLYRFWDGKKDRWIDPLEQYKRLMDRWQTINSDRIAAFAPMGSKFSLKCHENMVKQMREVFSVDSYIEGGLTDEEVILLIPHFFSYCDEVREAFEEASDNTDGNLAAYVNSYFSLWRKLLCPKPTYLEHFGFWLNRRRVFFRHSGMVAFGAGVALGAIEPGLEYYRSFTDGDGEAKKLKGETEAIRRQSNAGSD